MNNSCGVSTEVVANIYPTFRVIAAINHRNPIPGVYDNIKVMRILSEAIKDNPENYRRLVERSQDWGGGIN